MNRRDFLKAFGLSAALALLPSGIVDASELDAPVTDEVPLAYVTINGVRYSLVSFDLSIMMDLYDGTRVDVTIEINGAFVGIQPIYKRRADFSITVPGVKANFSGIMDVASQDVISSMRGETSTIAGAVPDGLTINIAS